MNSHPRHLGIPLILITILGAASCGARSGVAGAESEDDTACPNVIDCIAPSADDPCGAPKIVGQVCDFGAPSCPAGSRPYARAASTPAECSPFVDDASGVQSIGGSLVRVPTDDGRCVWIAENVETSSGEQLRNVGFVADTEAPFGTCPHDAKFVGGGAAPVVALSSGDDPTLLVSIASSYRLNGKTRVFYRLFRLEADAPYGVQLLGSGIGGWDASGTHIVVGGPDSLPFGPDLDLGDAAFVAPPYAYAWGCPRQEFLADGCVEARFDEEGSMELLGKNGQFAAGAHVGDAATVFSSGPWVSSVVTNPTSSGLLHVFAGGFATTLQTHSATKPEATWSAPITLAACDLPAGDDKAYCAGPVVHEELGDPTKPGELVVSYGLGTTRAGSVGANPTAYSTRLVWLQAP